MKEPMTKLHMTKAEQDQTHKVKTVCFTENMLSELNIKLRSSKSAVLLWAPWLQNYFFLVKAMVSYSNLSFSGKGEQFK